MAVQGFQEKQRARAVARGLSLTLVSESIDQTERLRAGPGARGKRKDKNAHAELSAPNLLEFRSTTDSSSHKGH